MPSAALPYLTIGELGDTLGVQCRRIARLFELGVLPEPPRRSGEFRQLFRVISRRPDPT